MQVFFLLFFMGLVALNPVWAKASKACSTATLAYNTDSGRFLSRYPDLSTIAEHITKSLLNEPRLSPAVRDYLMGGGDPLRLAIPGVLDAMETALMKLIDRSDQLEVVTKRLKKGLARAIADLRANPPTIEHVFDDGFHPPGGGGGGGGSGGGGGAFDPKIEDFIEESARARCVQRNYLLMASTIVMNLATSIAGKWKEYSGEEAGSFTAGLFTLDTPRHLASRQLWGNAIRDRDFWHNNGLNILQMSLLGSAACFPSMKMGMAFNLGANAVLSLISQQVYMFFSTNENVPKKLDYGLAAFDTAFAFLISTTKMKTVFWLSERLRASATPLFRVLIYESIMQLISEGAGGGIYTWALKNEGAFVDSTLESLKRLSDGSPCSLFQR